MIFNLTEYAKAQEEMYILEERLERLQQTHPIGLKGFTKEGRHYFVFSSVYPFLLCRQGMLVILILTERITSPVLLVM
ncbi:MAG: hypothetical protein JJV91_02350 [Desulfosarcina sp.]|nr:hypothetical protein [Desulfobacterales bacterium]